MMREPDGDGPAVLCGSVFSLAHDHLPFFLCVWVVFCSICCDFVPARDRCDRRDEEQDGPVDRRGHRQLDADRALPHPLCDPPGLGDQPADEPQFLGVRDDLPGDVRAHGQFPRQERRVELAAGVSTTAAPQRERAALEGPRGSDGRGICFLHSDNVALLPCAPIVCLFVRIPAE